MTSCASEVQEIASARRYNLQETLAHAIFDRIAAFRGVADVRLRLSKPDVYPEAHGVGVEIASFSGAWPTPTSFTAFGCGTKSVAWPLRQI